MARVYRPKGDARSVSRLDELRVASTDGIYKVSDTLEKLVEGEGEAVDILDDVAYAVAGRVYYKGRIFDFGSRVLDLSLSPEGLAIAGKRNEIWVILDNEIRKIPVDNWATGIDWLGDKIAVSLWSGKAIVFDLEGNVIDKIYSDRPFTALLTVGERIYIGVSDGGIYSFTINGEIEEVGEHVRRVFGLDYWDYLFSVGEDRYVKARNKGLYKAKKLHFDTYDVAAYEGKIAVVGPRYIRVSDIEEL